MLKAEHLIEANNIVASLKTFNDRIDWLQNANKLQLTLRATLQTSSYASSSDRYKDFNLPAEYHERARAALITIFEDAVADRTRRAHQIGLKL